MTTLSSRLGAELRFTFTSGALPESAFDVVDLEGHEAISQLYRFTLTLVSDEAEVDFNAMLEHPATLVIQSPKGERNAPYHGVLAEFKQLNKVGDYVFYRAVLVPRLWKLSQNRISEIYLQDKPIPDLLQDILKTGRLAGDDTQFKLKGEYRPRSFVCQFEESHLNFLSRWLEHEGIYYYFDQDEQERLIAVDDLIFHDAEARQVNYRAADELDTGFEPDNVQEFLCRQVPLPKKVILQDFNYRKAALTLREEADVDERGDGEVMYYGENFRTPEEGRRYAKLRAEALNATGRLFLGQATAVGLKSGHFMELAHHYRQSFNGKYLVSEIHHHGSQAGALLAGLKLPNAASQGEDERGTRYGIRFTALPADVQYRPPRTTPKPRIAGVINATIDGEGSGEFAELDQYGQYKVQLPFDLTEKNPSKGSTRLRMASPYAGDGHGMHFPLHKETEVLIAFANGDPDLPIILSAVPNSENENIVNNANPSFNDIRTGNAMIRMADATDDKGLLMSTRGTLIYMG